MLRPPSAPTVPVQDQPMGPTTVRKPSLNPETCEATEDDTRTLSGDAGWVAPLALSTGHCRTPTPANVKVEVDVVCSPVVGGVVVAGVGAAVVAGGVVIEVVVEVVVEELLPLLWVTLMVTATAATMITSTATMAAVSFPRPGGVGGPLADWPV